MISKIYNSDKILFKAWSRKGKRRDVIELKSERMKDKKVQNRPKMKELIERIEKYKKQRRKKWVQA